MVPACRSADGSELALSSCHADSQGLGVAAGHPVPLGSHALTPGAGRFFGNSRKKREAVFRPELRRGKEIGRIAISGKRRTALRLALPRLRAAARCAPTWGTRSRPNAATAVKGAGLGRGAVGAHFGIHDKAVTRPLPDKLGRMGRSQRWPGLPARPQTASGGCTAGCRTRPAEGPRHKDKPTIAAFGTEAPES